MHKITLTCQVQCPASVRRLWSRLWRHLWTDLHQIWNSFPESYRRKDF